MHPEQLYATEEKTLACGEALCHSGQGGQVWRLMSGALLASINHGDERRFVNLILPGDLVGAEQYAGRPSQFDVHALDQATLLGMPSVTSLSAEQCHEFVFLSYFESRERASEALGLRTGPVTERVKYLLCLLTKHVIARGNKTVSCGLPALKAMSLILDVAPESISRVISGFRREGILLPGQNDEVTFNLEMLRSCKLISEQIWRPGVRSGSAPAHSSTLPHVC